jgi:DNA-binding Xre family transcriptional regulator
MNLDQDNHAPLRNATKIEQTEQFMRVLRTAITHSDLTREMIVQRTGISLGAISRIKNGKTRWPRPATFEALCQVLGLQMTLTHRRLN